LSEMVPALEHVHVSDIRKTLYLGVFGELVQIGEGKQEVLLHKPSRHRAHMYCTSRMIGDLFGSAS